MRFAWPGMETANCRVVYELYMNTTIPWVETIEDISAGKAVP